MLLTNQFKNISFYSFVFNFFAATEIRYQYYLEIKMTFCPKKCKILPY